MAAFGFVMAIVGAIVLYNYNTAPTFVTTASIRAVFIDAAALSTLVYVMSLVK